ncbi:hypothetical protein FDP41_001151 [Naegleria fowleri]|uniref:Uncharacterized protein n=1 Tax=Naegleria fowleri TaxID=5763 RepID=A0A6A5C280_NAEFO|nr:uncharacterized protein FDP41_001151 [Naegleria fowleri]KAF0979998.1 hypothetical protein FDP41_001151 [Naegleria fowleri]CAG4718120.1 unnamed protein product [Naegleria fowleri]
MAEHQTSSHYFCDDHDEHHLSLSSSTKKQIIFIRHGRSVFNELYVESGENCPPNDPWVIDSELSEIGLSQVQVYNGHLGKLLEKALKSTLRNDSHKQSSNNDCSMKIISSPLTRCIQTCFHVLNTHQILLVNKEETVLNESRKIIEIDPDCTELEESSCDVGSTYCELIANEKMKHILSHFDLRLIENRGKWWYQSEDNSQQTVHFEPWEHFMERVRRFTARLHTDLTTCDTIVVFSHFTFIRECVNYLASSLKIDHAHSIVGEEESKQKNIPISNLENREVIILEFDRN